MVFGDSFLAYIQRQEYIANQQFELNEVEYSFDLIYNQIHDAYVTEEERWEEICCGALLSNVLGRLKKRRRAFKP